MSANKDNSKENSKENDDVVNLLNNKDSDNEESNIDNQTESASEDSESDDLNDKNNDEKTDMPFEPMNFILQQVLQEAMKIDKNSKNSYLVPINFDFKIENYDSDGKIKSEKIVSSKDGNIFYDFKVSDKNDESEKINQNDNETDKETNTNSEVQKNKETEESKENEESTENEESKENEESTETKVTEESKENEKKLKNDKSNSSQKKRKTFIKQVKEENAKININKIDYASSIGDEKYLNEWLNSNLDSSKKFIGSISDYSTESIDNASSNNKINILHWWLDANKKYNLELKYTEKSINFASKGGYIECLEWWVNSGLELKYNYNAIDYASSEGKIQTLDWWLNAHNKLGLKFEYTSNSIDNARLDENKLLKLVKWWKQTINSKPKLKFKFTRDFIDYLEVWDYKEIYKFLQENKMIAQNEKFSPKNKNSPMSEIFGMLGFPVNLMGSSSTSKSKDSASSKYDLDSLPEDIQKHIREKEEELSNNMLINGKAKEYIDNLIKIPFGKYKIEKIFSFIENLINKINQINLSSSNDFVKNFKLTNESDLIDFFEKTKYYPDNTYLTYSKIYQEFVSIRKSYMEYVNKVLEQTVYGHVSTKKHIKCIISQWLSGGFKTGVVIGIQGPPGVGKTTMIKGALSKCLIDYIDYDLDCDEPFVKIISEDTKLNDVNSSGRPFCFMSLGGTTNGSTLSGHNITYHGATSGDIVKHLKEAKVMNPILYFDELDKISNTEHGHEISSVLTHITDPVQNSHFTDRYFAEVKIDLSKCIIVFSYNDTSRIDRILLDRIQEIRLNPIKQKEKLIICKKFIIPEICSQLGYNPNDISISDDKLDLVISEYTLEAGVRKLKEKLYEIFRMNHLELIENPTIESNKVITEKFIEDTFADYHKISYKKIKKSNMVGCINGLYASASGIGGITPIQAKQIYSKDNLATHITGSVEKVMEESVKVAKTVAWNQLTRDEQNKVIGDWDSRGIHIHFPDGATPKDGPSAGTAITCAIYSLLTNKPIRNNIAITGEIDLDGNVTEIGGLDAKLNGAKRAGIRTALVPKENTRELDIVIKNNPELLDKNFKVFKISHVSDALKYIF
jgi:ATP-dependent Lon protease